MRSKLMCTAAVTAVTLTGGALAPADAEEQSSDPITAIQAAAPEVLKGVADAPAEESGDIAIELNAGSGLANVKVPVDPADGITFESSEANASISIGLPNADDASSAIVEADGVVSYDNGDGSTTVPVVKSDGSLQVTTVIDGPDAPTRYEYPIELPEGGALVDAGDGFFAAVDADGLPIAMISPAWAKDANGEDIATHYEVNGTSLVQVVEHSAGTVYPVVADPTYRGRLITAVGLKTDPKGTIVAVTAKKDYSVRELGDNFYAEYKLWVNPKFHGQKYRDQLVCHVFNARNKSPWNIDSWRPNVGYHLTVVNLCNPN
ncbi:DUF2599 domain-containing protein [Agromyces sp. NPDC058126]|uniref:DUF2599 domain-containing protein n=1 Tax=Agromyces sp. NPDC058126 TaxID=3346350 RepID=UPI0036DC42F2